MNTGEAEYSQRTQPGKGPKRNKVSAMLRTARMGVLTDSKNVDQLQLQVLQTLWPLLL